MSEDGMVVEVTPWGWSAPITVHANQTVYEPEAPSEARVVRRLRQPEPARDLRSRIEDALRSYRCQHLSYHDDGGGMQLVDVFSDGQGSIRQGDREVELLADHIVSEAAEPAREGGSKVDRETYEHRLGVVAEQAVDEFARGEITPIEALKRISSARVEIRLDDLDALYERALSREASVSADRSDATAHPEKRDG